MILQKEDKSFGAVPSFKGIMGSLQVSASINNEVVHGIPNKNKIIKDAT